MEKQKKNDLSIKDIAVTLGILAVCTLIGFAFAKLNFDTINTILVYIVGVVLIAMRTRGHLLCMIASVISVVLFNFFFAAPYFSLVAEPDYFATFAVMLLVSFMISSLTIQIKKSSEEAARMEERAKQEALRADLLRSISHDLRTPLTGISGNATMLKKHGAELSEPIRQEIYTSIDEDSHWLIGLVENLLLITRLSDRVNMNMQSVIVKDLVDEALTHVDRNSINYRITTSYDNEMQMINADERCMLQVVVNIINNAIKYTPEGSEINVAVQKDGDEVVMRFADNGPGISEDAKKRIFDMFYVEGKLSSDSRRGLGLGLYLCRSILEAHGGSIRVGDNSPHGTVFECRLPAADIDRLHKMENQQ